MWMVGGIGRNSVHVSWTGKDGAPRFAVPDRGTLRIGGRQNEGLRQTAVEVARIIREYENTHFQERTIQPRPADSSIYNLEMNGRSIAQDMAEQGISWTQADKRPGSRKLGWERIRTMMQNAGSDEPGLYIFNHCRQFIRTVPTLTRTPGIRTTWTAMQKTTSRTKPVTV